MLYFQDTCPELPEISNGKKELRIEASQTKRVYVTKYQCNEGYYLKANLEERQCSPEGLFDSKSQFVAPNQWTGIEPECLLIGKLEF